MTDLGPDPVFYSPAPNFRDLLAEALARSFYAMSPGDLHAPTIAPVVVVDTDDYQVADAILALPVPWVDCPTCVAKGFDPVTENDCGTGLIEYLTCPACTGTGHATVAQLLAWGQAAAQTDPMDYEVVDDYRNRILDTLP